MNRLLRAMASCAALTVVSALHAQTLHLKCAVGGPYADGSHISWIEIDQSANFMRVRGEALVLSVTNSRYSATSRNSRTFATIHSIDRESGEITVAELYEGKITSTKKGICEKGEPPATKF